MPRSIDFSFCGQSISGYDLPEIQLGRRDHICLKLAFDLRVDDVGPLLADAKNWQGNVSPIFLQPVLLTEPTNTQLTRRTLLALKRIVAGEGNLLVYHTQGLDQAGRDQTDRRVAELEIASIKLATPSLWKKTISWDCPTGIPNVCVAEDEDVLRRAPSLVHAANRTMELFELELNRLEHASIEAS